MPRFSYIAHNISGEEKTGSLTAPDRDTAAARLRSRGLFPFELTGTGLQLPAPEKTGPRSRSLNRQIRLPAGLTRVPHRQLMVLTRQTATLIRSGFPLLRGLRLLERQEKNSALKKALGDIAAAIEGGSTLADALAAHPRIFSRLYISMVKAGESGGLLDVVLDRLASYMEKAQKLRNRIKSAMTYPMVVLLAAAAILIFLMTSIIPRFELIFADLLEGGSLPPLTRAVMAVSSAARHRWLYGLAAAAAAALLTAALKRFRSGRLLLDSLRLSFPLAGNLFRMSLIARFARTLGTLMQSGVPVLQALSIVKDTLGSERMADAVQRIHDHIREGETMAAPIEACRLFPPLFAGMVEVGEETGELPAMLIKAADLYEDETDSIVAALSSIIEPLLIIVLAVVVGIIVIAMFMPMVSIIGNLS